MQGTTLNVFFAKNTATNHEPLPPLKMPPIASFEASLHLRLETFALDVQDNLKHSLTTEAEDLQEQLEIQLNQLQHLLNDVRWFRWCNEQVHAKEASQKD
jgi:hypothetical protein